MRFPSTATIASTTTFSENIRNLFLDKAALFEGTEVPDFFDTLAKKRAELIATSGKTAVSSSLDEADRIRDVSFRNVFTALDAYLIFPNEETKAAANEIAMLISKFSRSMTSKNYANQSADEERFFKTLDAASETLEKMPYMSELVAQAKADEEAFKKVNKEYTQAVAASSGDKNATVLKRELIAFMNDTLFPYLQAVNLMNKGKYDAFLKEIEVEISRQPKQQQPKAVSQKQQPQADSQKQEDADFQN